MTLNPEATWAVPTPGSHVLPRLSRFSVRELVVDIKCPDAIIAITSRLSSWPATSSEWLNLVIQSVGADADVMFVDSDVAFSPLLDASDQDVAIRWGMGEGEGEGG